MLQTTFNFVPLLGGGWGHGGLPVLSVVCCQVEVSTASCSLIQRSSTVVVCILEAS